MKKTIGIFAHVDAGKTTLCEALLYNNKAIHKKGTVNTGDTVMDAANVEKQRGITCFSGAAGFKYNNNDYYLIDTPGHTDFLPDTERCMAALDCAVICVSAVEGVESNTELLWEMLAEKNIPCIFFINKCDRDISDADKTVNELQKRFSPYICFYLSDEYTENVVAENDVLMEKYFSGTAEKNEIETNASVLFMKRKLFPAIRGSALQNTGVDELMAAVDTLCRTQYSDTDPFKAEIFKVSRIKDKRVLFCHIRSGSVFVRDELCQGERVSEIKLFDSARSSNANVARAGDVVQIYGISSYNAGDCIGIKEKLATVIPTMTAKVIYPSSLSSSDMYAKLKILEDEEPTLSVEHVLQTGEISVRIMGKIQLEILKQRIAEYFDIEVDFGKCEVIYKETLCDATVGYGHYEPLRHYSEVHIRIEPMPKGSGISYESECSLNLLTSNYQNLIRTHIFEKEHKGVLIGATLTDVKYTLITGAAHEKHTEGGDFREAVYRAVRHGLMRGKSKLLEPYYRCRFCVESSLCGKVLSDITRMCGKNTSSETAGESSVIISELPVANINEYQNEFVSFTRGKGRLTMSFCGYDDCHNENEVIQRYSYQPERDLENTPDSVFCAKGAGFLVPWHEVEKYIHCK
ncbi:MAG: TetM/TetW/TetO/TetS family tetracycline resistance ribosomal protection protein [Clostridia bacterium]|nr:TetM/TetW/TetO/TetS family tetracycline resistance ribosomal protection protein [Clostridia bacterium]